MTIPSVERPISHVSGAIRADATIGKKVLTMTDFYFVIGKNPKDVFVVVGEKWILYKHCETEEIARAIVDGQNKSRGERLKLVRTTGTF